MTYFYITDGLQWLPARLEMKMSVYLLSGHPLSFRTFRRPLFPIPVSSLGLFSRFLQQDSSRRTFFLNDFLYLGEGHNLQEHSIVLVKYHPLPDVPGVKLRCVRGARDLPHVIKKKQ